MESSSGTAQTPSREQSGLVHRILTSPVAGGMPAAEAHRYWREHHSTIVPAIDHLVGYVQNAPLPRWWSRLPFLVCADTWFSSKADERDAYESDYYRATIVPDEEHFIDRARAWHSVVSGIDTILDGPRARLRVLAFGADVDAVSPELGWSRVEVLELRRAAPGARGATLLSAWTDDLERAEALADSIGELAYVAAPAIVVPPPLPGWDPAAEPWDWA